MFQVSNEAATVIKEALARQENPYAVRIMLRQG